MSDQEKNSRGRPPWKPTRAQRRKVAIAAGGGMSQEQIAAALGITKPTLVRHCHEELTHGAQKARMEAIQALFTAAKRGSVSAIKAYRDMYLEPVDPPGSEHEKPEPVGKKARQQAEAVDAHVGSDWESLLSNQPLQ